MDSATVLLYSHDACRLHSNAPGHPERAERVDAAMAGVYAAGATVEDRSAPQVDLELLYPVHDPGYVADVREACESGGRPLDPDTGVVEASWEAALRAAGAGVAAAQALRSGEGALAFLAIRPPGHHALLDRAMGFCLFNNVAITASSLVERGEKVAILDWDVHHGNGTQGTFFRSEAVVYVSLHQFPLYPGTGWVDEVGTGPGRGHSINIPLPPGSGGAVVRRAVDAIVSPVLDEFDADWLLVSAGFDGHVDDPLAELRYEAADYGWLGERLLTGYAGRTIVFLEGGYDLDAVRNSSEATVRGATGDAFAPGDDSVGAGASTMIEMAAEAAAVHWSGVQGG